jgi:hypothetical protein
MSERSQRIILWWGIAFAAIYGAALLFLLHMVPPPAPTKSPTEVADFYNDHHDAIRIGATIASWTSAFMVPIFAVIVVQMKREEGAKPIWTVLTAMGGAMMSIFLVLPPLFWGVAAYTDHRVDPEVTTIMHELGCLTLTTTDQYYIFAWIGVAVIALMPKHITNSPFPRWYGYFTLWTAFMFEAGAIAFLPRTGPFCWRGLLVFWSPLTLFSLWIGVTCFLLFRAIRRQEEEAAATPAAPA